MTLLKRPSKPGGGRFFKADELRPGTKAKIRAVPFTDTVQNEEGVDEDRFRVPIAYEGEDGIWSPGITAANILFDELGEQDTNWIGQEIQFVILEVPTQSGTRYAKGAHVMQAQLTTESASGIVGEGKCPSCGAATPTGTKFCPRCGRKMME